VCDAPSSATTWPDSARDNETTWAAFEARGEATSTVDYGCQFKNGLCKRMSNAKSPTATMYCCSDCGYTVGFLTRIPRAALREIVGLFSPKLGFWRSGVGCVLPRKWRSTTCLAYACNIQPEEQEKLYQILNGKVEVVTRTT
jgi:hypothetical protein